MKLRIRLAAGAAALAVSTFGLVGLGATTAHAVDSYYCGDGVKLGNGTVVEECLHLGGNGYWQPYVFVGAFTNVISGSQWINSNGQHGDITNIATGQYWAGNIWGKSTNWRSSCYVQAQVSIDFPGEAYNLFSPSEYVC
ncbi:hypothetical protein [Streptomyces sp. NPDC004232]|uniref:hypothetical protein n=1 Tax=unclassified Streptomyces TaxID=2593676 RepID=UPI001DDC9813|nr:hypothetical protein [Streptomyces sp. tea 10]